MCLGASASVKRGASEHLGDSRGRKKNHHEDAGYSGRPPCRHPRDAARRLRRGLEGLDRAGTVISEVDVEHGTCTVEPLEAHADLLNDKGTWEGTADEVTLHLEKAGDITLKVTGKANLEGDAHAFDIADFDVIQFDFYG